ncbi:hypothetical protein APHAL10511_000586 [Amanita phalloides]|nr:hypothetical protein APHAL10511_000586 [Amanita phalloides]
MAHSEQHRTNRVTLYRQPPEIITNYVLALSAMRTVPPNPISPSNFILLLSGPLDVFFIYSRGERSQWSIDIAHDVCDPALKRGSLQMWDVAGQMWRNVNHADPLIASTYLYNVQAMISLSKISRRIGKSKSSASGAPSTMADQVKKGDGRCWVTSQSPPASLAHGPRQLKATHLRCFHVKGQLAIENVLQVFVVRMGEVAG